MSVGQAAGRKQDRALDASFVDEFEPMLGADMLATAKGTFRILASRRVQMTERREPGLACEQPVSVLPVTEDLGHAFAQFCIVFEDVAICVDDTDLCHWIVLN